MTPTCFYITFQKFMERGGLQARSRGNSHLEESQSLSVSEEKIIGFHFDNDQLTQAHELTSMYR